MTETVRNQLERSARWAALGLKGTRSGPMGIPHVREITYRESMARLPQMPARRINLLPGHFRRRGTNIPWASAQIRKNAP